MPITQHHLHISVPAVLRHSAPALGGDDQTPERVRKANVRKRQPLRDGLAHAFPGQMLCRAAAAQPELAQPVGQLQENNLRVLYIARQGLMIRSGSGVTLAREVGFSESLDLVDVVHQRAGRSAQRRQRRRGAGGRVPVSIAMKEFSRCFVEHAA
jgi:hypothetical protein